MSHKEDPLIQLNKLLPAVIKFITPIILIIASIIILLNAEFPNKIHAEAEEKLYSKELISTQELKRSFNTKIASEINSIKKRLNEKQLAEKSQKMEAVFSRYGGKMSGLSKLLITRAQECGGDPRVVFAIAGNESGFGRIPYKLYNPFGYLDGVQYTSWEESIYILSCKISQQHLAPCNNRVECVIVRYGGSDTNRAKWIRNINYFISLV